jgi:hypothetical protein
MYIDMIDFPIFEFNTVQSSTVRTTEIYEGSNTLETLKICCRGTVGEEGFAGSRIFKVVSRDPRRRYVVSSRVILFAPRPLCAASRVPGLSCFVCAFIETFGNQHHHQHHHLLWLLLLLCPRRGCSVGGVSNRKQKSSHKTIHNRTHTCTLAY